MRNTADRKSFKRKVTSLALAFNMVLPLGLTLTAEPVYALNKELSTDLTKMEIKFFDHDYKKDSEENRIERVEKLVFGESKTGSEEDRMSALLAAVPDLNSDKKTDKQKNDQGSAQDNSSTQSGSDKSQGADNSNSDEAAADPSTDYPRVDAIEQVLLGKTYRDEGLGKRLAQLEMKAFKKVSSDPDLSKRTEDLEKYVQKHYHKSISNIVDPRNTLNYQAADNGGGNGYESAPPQYGQGSGYGYGGGGAYSGSSGSSGSYGMTPPSYGGGYRGENQDSPPSMGAPVAEQLTWLESHVYGRSFPQKPLIDRVRDLEKSVFPNEPPDTTSSIPMQVKVLVNAVSLMHKGPSSPPVAPARQPASNFPNWPPAGNTETSNANEAGGEYTGGGTANGAYGGYAAQNQASEGAYQGYNQGYGGGYQNSYGNQSNMSYQPPQQFQQSQQTQQTQQQPQQKKGHPLLKSLAKTLLTVGAVAAGSVLGGGYGGYGYGGYGGYGYGNPMYGGAYGMNGAYGNGYYR
ncbi:MAG: hypothetical protein KC652_15990 [Cyanobacteria bacterium HKST-UBA01]|nr:hypothetical protein [Cyanobacteria bacterium HKST-UBA01]